MKAVLQIAYDPALAEQRHALLSKTGYRVVTAHNNAEAKAACNSQSFSAIVLGYASPLPNRRTMMEWLREHCPGVPIISLYSRQFIAVPKADFAIDGEEFENWLGVLNQILA